MVDWIYILHHTPLNYRKNYISEKINDLGYSNVSFCELYLPETIEKKANLKKSEVSLFMKHLWCISDAIYHSYSNIIIFEDDIDFDVTFDISEFIEFVLTESEINNYDISWIGGTPELSVSADCNVVHTDKKYSSRCTHGMMISSRCFDVIKELLVCGDLPLDHAYNKLISENTINSFWTYPYFEQKTINGKDRSSIR